MRIGLLECDHVRANLRPIAGDYVDMFTAMVAEADPSACVVPYDIRRGAQPARPDECDAWLCTGSSSSVYDDDPWIAALTGFVRQVQDAGVPFVGICFGHQLIAHALGGRTERAAVGWGAGALPLRIVAPAPWMDLPTGELTLLYSHQDQVTTLPPGGAILGEAPHCPVAMLTVGPRMLGVQAHPEFRADYLRALIESRVERLTPQGVARARESLSRATDGSTVAHWIVSFLRQGVSPGDSEVRDGEPDREPATPGGTTMGDKTDQDQARLVGDRLMPPTIPDRDTIKEDRAAVDAPHDAGREPTPEEEAAAGRSADAADPDVAEHYEDMIDRGAAQQGEGAPGP